MNLRDVEDDMSKFNKENRADPVLRSKTVYMIGELCRLKCQAFHGQGKIISNLMVKFISK